MIAAPLPQHLTALGRANEVRLARAALKRSVAAGATTAADVILTCPWETASMTIAELLSSQQRWRTVRTARFLTVACIPEHKTIGSLTTRQRNMLAEMLRR